MHADSTGETSKAGVLDPEGQQARQPNKPPQPQRTGFDLAFEVGKGYKACSETVCIIS